MQRRLIFWGNAMAQLALLIYLAFTPLGKRVYLSGVRLQSAKPLVCPFGADWGLPTFLISTIIALPFRSRNIT